MVRIMHEAESDCAKSDISVKYEISYVSYHDFLLEYEPWSLEKEELSSGLVGHEQTNICSCRSKCSSRIRSAITQGYSKTNTGGYDPYHTFCIKKMVTYFRESCNLY